MRRLERRIRNAEDNEPDDEDESELEQSYSIIQCEIS